MKYKTIIEHSERALDEKVNTHLMSGWQLYGGPYSVGTAMAQALVLKEPD